MFLARTALGVCLIAAFVGCSRRGPAPAAPKTLLVYCGGTMRQPMEAVAAAYLKKTGVRVDLSYGDSGTLLIQLERRREGDGLVVHDPFAAIATSKGLVAATRRVASLEPAIGVKIGTRGEREVRDLADLAKPGLKIGVPDARKATAGQILAAMLQKAGLTDAVMKNAVLVSRASGDLVNALSLGNVDAVVAWDALIRRDPNLRVIPIDERFRVDAVTSATGRTYDVKAVNVTLSALKSSRVATATAEFLEFAAGPEGRAAFEQFAFSAPR